MFKKLITIIGILFGLFVAAAVIVPLVVNVDKYRPQIVEAAGEKINGKLELGKLSLSLWGQIKIQIDGLILTDFKGNQVVAVKEAYFHLPFASLLEGSPLLTLKMDKPEVHVLKDKTGKMNLMTLVKEAPKSGTPSTPAAPSTPVPAPKTSTGGSTTLPGMATRARVGIELANALVVYQDEATGLSTQLKDLNIVFKDISLSRPTELEIWAVLDTTFGKSLVVKGPFRISGKAQPIIKDGKFDSATLSFKVNLDDLNISAGGTFEKNKGTAANLEGIFSSTPQVAKIEKLTVKFFNAEIDTTGEISNLGQNTSPIVKLSVKSNEIEMKPWSELVPMLKQFELAGKAGFSAEANGPSDKLAYKADLSIDGLTAKAPTLKTQPRLDVAVHVVTDKLEKLMITMKAPGNDLKIEGSMVSFTAPQANFMVTSTGMDLDELVIFPPPAPKGAPVAQPKTEPKVAEATKKGVAAKPAPAVDMDSLLDPIRENKMLASMGANIGINMKSIKVQGVRISDLTSKITFHDLVAAIESFNMGVFGGKIGMNASVSMKPKTPTYHFGANVTGLDIKAAASSQMEILKNTVLGIASFKIDGAGSSFNTEPAKLNLTAKGNFKVDQATFATMDIGKMATEGLNKAIDKIAEKIPQAKGKGIKSVPGRESKYDFISASFAIMGGKFTMPDFIAKAAPNQGIDLKGSTTLGLVDMSLKANWDVIDTYNYTQARDVSIDQAGIKVDHLLAEGNGPVHFPVEVGCYATAPCYSYTAVPEYLTKVAVNNVTKAASGKAKAKAQEAVSAIAKKAPPAVQKQIDEGIKKLFH